MNTELRTKFCFGRHPRHNPPVYWIIGRSDDKDANLFHSILNKKGYPRKFQSLEAAERALARVGGAA